MSNFMDAAERRELLFCCYLGFENAFNSVDHEALWRWLKELNVPDIDLLQNLLWGILPSRFAYGRSAQVVLSQQTGRQIAPHIVWAHLQCLTPGPSGNWSGVSHGLGPPVSCQRVCGWFSAYYQILWGHVPAPRRGGWLLRMVLDEDQTREVSHHVLWL